MSLLASPLKIMQVIDIPSSPEPSSSQMLRRARSASRQPGPPKKRLRPAAREPSIVEIIELSDSDSDLSPSRSRTTKSSQPEIQQKTPYKMLSTIQPPLVTPTNPPVSAPGSSQHVVHPELQPNGVPLFLRGSDDEGPLLAVSVAQDVLDVAPPLPPQPVPPEPASAQTPPFMDPIDEHIIRVLEIVPDVQPAHALALIEQFMQSQPGNVVEFVLHALFENPSYPKVDKKGKHKRDEPDRDSNARASLRPKVDYTSKERVYDCGPHYFDRSLDQLMTDFPRIPKPHIRSRLSNHRFYAPTYLLLAEELKRQPLPFKLKSTNSVVGKGKARQDPEFDKEREWVLLKVTELATELDAALAASVNEQEYEASGQGIECGCCFSEFPFDQMIQCPEAHLFCKSCMSTYASNLLGEHNPNIVCMDQSGCKLLFPESELARFLSSKLLELYYRVKQRKEIEAAGLENLEECPFCEYKCVIDNAMEKLFRCENVDCGAVSCRACKKPDHLPKTCKEVEDDKHLDAQHIVEEAMTQALMRNCPKCQKSFIKEYGCNKMTCPNCHTVSCYICRKVIHGYEHFSNSSHPSNKTAKSKCNLWDPVEQRHAEEVTEAAKRALADLRQSRPELDQSHLKVDIPVVRAPPRPAAVGAPIQGAFGLNGVAGLPPYPAAGAMRMMPPGPIPPGPMGMIPPGPMRMNPGAARLADIAAGWHAGMGAGPGGPMDLGAWNDPFVFGVGRAHPFVPPVLNAPPPLLWNRPDPPREAAPMLNVPLPLALARGRRMPQGHVPGR